MTINWTAVAKSAPVVGLSFIVVLATLVIEGYGILVGFSPAANEIVLGRVLGTFDTITVMVLSYWFGTTRGSSDKDAVIARQLPGPGA